MKYGCKPLIGLILDILYQNNLTCIRVIYNQTKIILVLTVLGNFQVAFFSVVNLRS